MRGERGRGRGERGRGRGEEDAAEELEEGRGRGRGERLVAEGEQRGAPRPRAAAGGRGGGHHRPPPPPVKSRALLGLGNLWIHVKYICSSVQFLALCPLQKGLQESCLFSIRCC